ncbi:MAG: Rieske 2Fe-2S domain-containing protein, partial [Alphaproteobacteria bacterium]|nr:Rieske 2Fe-2S domain-containing protein [Alphaproteobacteria bacterium]
MDRLDGAVLRDWVREDRVDGRVFTDAALFELEMDRIFRHCWVFVGHDSQVPNPGDLYCTEIGRQPVVLTRHRDGRVHVLFNRCAHRGAKVLNQDCGHAERFECTYHGWLYDTDGRLAGSPMQRIEEVAGFDFR